MYSLDLQARHLIRINRRKGSSPVAPDSSCDECFVNLVHAYTRTGEDSYTHQPQPLVRFYCYDAHRRYDEDSKTRNSETSPPCRPANTNNEEQTEQQNQPQCNHSQCETEDIRIVTWERIDFARWSFSQILLVGCLFVLARDAGLLALVSPIVKHATANLDFWLANR